MAWKINKTKGFTIVELLIVVVVIAVLASITIVAFNGISQRAESSALKVDISNAAKKILTYQAENSVYPSSGWVTSNVVLGNGAVLDYTSTATTYCLQGTTGSLGMSIRETNGSPVESLCSVPATPTFGAAAATQVVVNWAAVPSATSYNVRCSRSTTYAAGQGNVTATVTSPTVTRTFTGLNAGTTYYCNVQAVVGASTGSWSANGSQTTSTPAAPSTPTSASIAQTSFTLNWGAVTGVYQYTARCALAANTTYVPTVYNNTGLTATTASITGLTANTAYICSVQARGYNTSSAFTSNVTVTTLP